MIKELLERPQWCNLWRMMGVQHMDAFGLMAIISDVNRFPKAKTGRLYRPFSESGAIHNNAKGREKALETLAELMCAHCEFSLLRMPLTTESLPCTNEAGSLL